MISHKLQPQDNYKTPASLCCEFLEIKAATRNVSPPPPQTKTAPDYEGI
jgi:hypothetical protein